MVEIKALTKAEIEEAIRDEAGDVFESGAWLEGVDSIDCPDPDQLMLNAAVGVVRLLFIHADVMGCAPETVIQALGYAVGDRVAPQDATFHRHAVEVLIAGLNMGLTGDTIGETEGMA